MTPFLLVWRYIAARPVVSCLNILLMSLGMALVTILLLVGHQLEKGFYAETDNVDLVVGAKGSPLQLILSTLHHIDIPTGNIPRAEAEQLSRHRLVRKAIPLALGDRYRRYRIVGTDPDYIRHFGGKLAEGQIWTAPMQAVIGARVASDHGLYIGSSFVGDHGLAGDAHTHEHSGHPYRVVGILEPTGRVMDRLILTSLDSVWEVHEAEQGAGVRDEITALLITYRSRAAAFTLPRFVNARTALQAASPRLEMARLTELVGLGRNSFLAIGGLLIFIAMAAIFVSQLNNMRERAYDLALFRILGASPGRLMGLMTLESVLLSSLGATLGVLLGHAVLFGAGLYVRDGLLSGITGIAVLPAIYIIWAVVVFSSFVSGLLVAWNAYRKELQENLVRQK